VARSTATGAADGTGFDVTRGVLAVTGESGAATVIAQESS